MDGRHPGPTTAALFAAALLGGAAAAGQSTAARRPAKAERPNIVFIYTDDQAAWTMSAARGAHPNAWTPHIDRIVREGAYLPNAFTVTPVCSPSRSELMTSRYGSELGITDWIHPRREPGLGLDPRTVTWPELLQRAGYTTAIVGKWHLGTVPRFHPTATGYGHFVGFLAGSSMPKDPVLEAEGREVRFTGFTSDILTDSAIAFIRRNAKEPFLLSLHFRAPHRPWLPVPEEDWERHRNLDPWIPNPDYPKLDVARVKRMTREYLASVAGVDRNVGQLLAALDELGLAENTMVVFTSDHGYNMGHNGIVHKGNGQWVLAELPPATENVPAHQRPNLYDHSLRVPAAVRWPRLIRAGTVVEETVTNLDWFPTLLEAAGVAKPASAPIRGRSVLPLLRGERSEGWDNDLYAEYSTHHQSWTHMRGYRTPEWKLVRDFLNPKRDELYRLATDPSETVNLIASEDPQVKRVKERLESRIRDRMRELNDPVLALEERPPGPPR